ncbi:hypothetical protein GCM10010433_19820 [Streptomyces pulveraceus]
MPYSPAGSAADGEGDGDGAATATGAAAAQSTAAVAASVAALRRTVMAGGGLSCGTNRAQARSGTRLRLRITSTVPTTGNRWCEPVTTADRAFRLTVSGTVHGCVVSAGFAPASP